MRPKGLSEAQASTESAAGLTRSAAAANASAEIATFTSRQPRSGRVAGRRGRNRSTTNSTANTRTTTIVKLVRSIMIETPRESGNVSRQDAAPSDGEDKDLLAKALDVAIRLGPAPVCREGEERTPLTPSQSQPRLGTDRKQGGGHAHVEPDFSAN